MNNPCVKCRRKPNCPKVCYPQRDYLRGIGKLRSWDQARGGAKRTVVWRKETAPDEAIQKLGGE